jgi:hypothetical protein
MAYHSSSGPKSNIVKTWGIYTPEHAGIAKGTPPFKLSRTKIDMFMECPLCFYLDRKLGIARPSMPSFTLNVAVDHLLKKEFDLHRVAGTAHPLMRESGIDAIPFSHPNMDVWRENFTGIQYLDPETNFLIFGAVDDVWKHADGSLAIVDYKATSKDGEVILEDSKWHNQYRRQMEIYQWLFLQNKFEVNPTGYFFYVNGLKDPATFNNALTFSAKIIPYTGDTSWIPDILKKAKACLDSNAVPLRSPTCEHCEYRLEAKKAYERHIARTKQASSTSH